MSGFRVWNYDSEGWEKDQCYLNGIGSLYQLKHGGIKRSKLRCAVEKETPFKDKDTGVPLYVGDIVLDDKQRVAQVVYNEDYGAFETLRVGRAEDNGMFKEFEYEKIGDIHNNPGLLKNET